MLQLYMTKHRGYFLSNDGHMLVIIIYHILLGTKEFRGRIIIWPHNVLTLLSFYFRYTLLFVWNCVFLVRKVFRNLNNDESFWYSRWRLSDTVSRFCDSSWVARTMSFGRRASSSLYRTSFAFSHESSLFSEAFSNVELIREAWSSDNQTRSTIRKHCINKNAKGPQTHARQSSEMKNNILL